MPRRSTIASRLYAGAQKHFSHDRWLVHENLRHIGFTKIEARELSKLGKDDPILIRMMEQRRRLLYEFSRAPAHKSLSDTQFRTRYHKYIRSWYEKRGYLTSKDSEGLDIKGKPGGKPSHWEWFRRLESRFRYSVKEQLERGEIRHASLKPSDMVRLVGYPDADPRSGKKSRGQVAAQKARARARGRAFRNHERASYRAGGS